MPTGTLYYAIEQSRRISATGNGFWVEFHTRKSFQLFLGGCFALPFECGNVALDFVVVRGQSKLHRVDKLACLEYVRFQGGSQSLLAGGACGTFRFFLKLSQFERFAVFGNLRHNVGYVRLVCYETCRVAKVVLFRLPEKIQYEKILLALAYPCAATYNLRLKRTDFRRS